MAKLTLKPSVEVEGVREIVSTRVYLVVFVLSGLSILVSCYNHFISGLFAGPSFRVYVTALAFIFFGSASRAFLKPQRAAVVLSLALSLAALVIIMWEATWSHYPTIFHVILPLLFATFLSNYWYKKFIVFNAVGFLLVGYLQATYLEAWVNPAAFVLPPEQRPPLLVATMHMFVYALTSSVAIVLRTDAESAFAKLSAKDKLSSAIASILSHDLKDKLLMLPNWFNRLKDNLTVKTIANRLIDEQKQAIADEMLPLVEVTTLALAQRPSDLLAAVKTAIGLKSDIIAARQLDVQVLVNGNPVTPETTFETRIPLIWFTVIANNVIGNSLRYSPDGGCVVVSLSRTAKSVLFEVTDNGSGIHEEDLPKIFEQGFSGQGSTGLGLGQVRTAATNLSATIAVESQVGQGTTFTFDIPDA